MFVKTRGAAQAEERRLTDLVVCSVIASYITVWCVIGASAPQFHRYERLIPPAAQSYCSSELLHMAAFQENMTLHIVCLLIARTLLNKLL